MLASSYYLPICAVVQRPISWKSVKYLEDIKYFHLRVTATLDSKWLPSRICLGVSANMDWKWMPPQWLCIGNVSHPGLKMAATPSIKSWECQPSWITNWLPQSYYVFGVSSIWDSKWLPPQQFYFWSPSQPGFKMAATTTIVFWSLRHLEFEMATDTTNLF